MLYTSSTALYRKSYAWYGMVDIFGGVVYVFDRLPPSKYKLKRVLKSPLEMNSNFGSSVAVYQDTLLVAANQYSK